MTNPPDLERWVAEYIERRDRNESLDPEQFLEEHPAGGNAWRGKILVTLHETACSSLGLPQYQCYVLSERFCYKKGDVL